MRTPIAGMTLWALYRLRSAGADYVVVSRGDELAPALLGATVVQARVPLLRPENRHGPVTP
jgi:hypothetical protein